LADFYTDLVGIATFVDRLESNPGAENGEENKHQMTAVADLIVNISGAT